MYSIKVFFKSQIQPQMLFVNLFWIFKCTLHTSQQSQVYLKCRLWYKYFFFLIKHCTVRTNLLAHVYCTLSKKSFRNMKQKSIFANFLVFYFGNFRHIWLKNHAFQHYMLECSKSIFFTVYHTCPGQYFLMQHTYRKINLSFPLMSLNENEGFRAVNTLSIFYLHEIEQLVRNRLDNF